jgi:tetratricopeptide (TPR) repeat protein
MSLDDEDGAEDAFRQAAAAAPKDARPYLSLGRLAAKRSRPSEAIQLYYQAAVIDSDYFDQVLASTMPRTAFPPATCEPKQSHLGRFEIISPTSLAASEVPPQRCLPQNRTCVVQVRCTVSLTPHSPASRTGQAGRRHRQSAAGTSRGGGRRFPVGTQVPEQC